MDQDTADAITKMEQQMAERDQKVAALEDANSGLATAIRALALKLDSVDEWIERVNLAFVKELAK